MVATDRNRTKATEKTTRNPNAVSGGAASGKAAGAVRTKHRDVTAGKHRHGNTGGIGLQPYERAEDVRRRIGFTPQAFARHLGIDPRTYSRRAGGQLRGSESLQVEMLDETLNEATRVFRDEELARRWMQSPIIGLDNRRPIDLLDSVAGYERVRDTLGKIAYGMY